MIILHAAGSKAEGIGNLARTFYLTEYLENMGRIILLWEAEEKASGFFGIPKGADRITVRNRKEALETLKKLDTAGSVYITDLTGLDKEYETLTAGYGFKKTAHLNDSLKDGYEPDILIDEDPFEKKRFHGKEADYFGADYKIFRKNLLKYRPEKPADGFKKILVSFGGSDPAEYTEKIAEIAGKTDAKGISFVLGPLMEAERKDLCKKLAPRCTFYENINDIGPLIADNDIIMSLGGITAYESALLGKAAVSIKWGNMAYYSEKLNDMGMLLALENTEEAGRFIADREAFKKKLRAVSEKGFKIITGNGGFAVRNIIKTLL